MPMPALPTKPMTVPTGADLSDDIVFRRLQIKHLAVQTLAVQRTEWFVRSIRIMVLIWFVLFIISVVIGFVWGIVVATSEPEPADAFGF